MMKQWRWIVVALTLLLFVFSGASLVGLFALGVEYAITVGAGVTLMAAPFIGAVMALMALMALMMWAGRDR